MFSHSGYTVRLWLSSDLVLDRSHHAFLAVVHGFGDFGHLVVQTHGEAALQVQRQLQARHLLDHFLGRLREERQRQCDFKKKRKRNVTEALL